MKVLLSAPDNVCKIYEDKFKKAGVELARCAWRDPEAMVANSKGATVVMIYGGGIPGDAIRRFDSSVKLILQMYIGFDEIDLAAAKERGIMVCNNPNYGTEEVAAFAISLILACNRKLKTYDDYMHNGVWHNKHFEPYASRRLSTMTLGVMGFGNIARYTAKFGLALGMNVVAYDPYVPEEVFKPFGVQKVELDELYAVSDAISVHIPSMPSTYHLVNEEAFKKMKDHVIIVNTARGPLIDIDALMAALKSGKVAAAGLDVFDKEPLDPKHPIIGFDNVILTPHAAYHTTESVFDVERLSTEIVLEYVATGKVPRSCVNRKDIGV